MYFRRCYAFMIECTACHINVAIVCTLCICVLWQLNKMHKIIGACKNIGRYNYMYDFKKYQFENFAILADDILLIWLVHLYSQQSLSSQVNLTHITLLSIKHPFSVNYLFSVYFRVPTLEGNLEGEMMFVIKVTHFSILRESENWGNFTPLTTLK